MLWSLNLNFISCTAIQQHGHRPLGFFLWSGMELVADRKKTCKIASQMPKKTPPPLPLLALGTKPRHEIQQKKKQNVSPFHISHHPRQPGSQHTVAETLANRPGPNTFHVVVECHSRPITALPYCLPTHSTACWYSWGFQKLTRISEIARDSGRLSANHVASYIDVLLGRKEHGSSHGICLSMHKFKISWICERKCTTLSPKTHR